MEICFSLPLPEYLRQWLVNAMGGEEPVRFPKGSAYTSFLRVFLRHKREREKWSDEPGAVRIVIPKFPGKSPEVHNYLPQRSEKALEQLVRDHFDTQLFTELVSFANIGRRRTDVLYAWMEDNGIEVNDRNTNAVLKRVQILRTRMRDRERKRSKNREQKDTEE